MSATTSTPSSRTAPAAVVDDALAQPSQLEQEISTKRRAGASADDWITAAVVFGILGGCIALWMADLSLVTGSLAAVFSGLMGILFADA
jgi:hypothetical protein